MKKNILALSLLAAITAGFASCSDDDLSSESVIKRSTTTETAFDKWLYKNFVSPYNIQIQWRYEDNESDMAYYDVPADSAQSVELAHIIKYTCVEAYTQAAGINFTRRYFPKLFSFLGEFEYENSGNIKLGTAEGGKKIRLLGVNHLDRYKNNRAYLDEYYLKTIHHEFVHIVNQTKDYPREFGKVTPNDYVNDSWSSNKYRTGFEQRGFVTAYSQKEEREDIAEVVSTYIISTPAQWNAILAKAVIKDDKGNAAKEQPGMTAINKKLEICKRYYKESFGIDLDKVRDAVIERESDVVSGNYNLTNLN
ncbi:putative lipoprotein [Prevotella denticola CRIS 18C-A]|uniref:Putative lipoprotein n=1 Tax=Prevotella denticola CRIS 18C-A TaxID=944557 RepID=F0H7W7_9BACT|nr:putative zinc-binding metallopeptidase [Prevotella denticola]EGC86147.1 putative lipoprotein [Prevotella denticola CRIS 18C-A]